MSGKKSKNLNMMLTFGAIILGAVLGLVFGEKMSVFKFIGTSWLNCIKMIIVPLVFSVMVLAIGTQSDVKALGRVALRLMIYFLVTTAFAVSLGLLSSFIFQPGKGMVLGDTAVEEIAGGSFSFVAFAGSLFSSSMFKTFADADILQTMVISIMIGIALLQVKDQEKKQRALDVLEAIKEVVFKYINMVIKAAPLGVTFLIADAFGQYGWNVMSSTMKLVGTFYVGILFQILITYCGFIWIFARINPLRFLRDTASVWTFTFASCSSVATIPISIECAKTKFKVPEKLASFCLPLGAQLNLDGAALLNGCVMMFIAQMYGLQYTPVFLIKCVIIATLVCSSGGGIPGGNIIKMMVVSETLGLPSEFVGVVAGFYRFFDMGTTTGNCLGDLAGTIGITTMERRRAQKKGIRTEWEDNVAEEETA